MPDNAVFISYAREDLPAVQRLKAGLEAAGVTTWFTAARIAGQAASKLRTLKPNSDVETSQSSVTLAFAENISAQANYERGDFAAAEQNERAALQARKVWGTESAPDQRDLGEMSTWLSMAIARQGRAAEANQTIRPVIKLQRRLAARNHGDQWVAYELAVALYAQSLSDPKHADALLREAAGLLNGLGPELRPLRLVRRLRERIGR